MVFARPVGRVTTEGTSGGQQLAARYQEALR
jgi:hypothetical protein